MTFDPLCLTLAKALLRDKPLIDDELHARKLANVIRLEAEDAIEYFVARKEKETSHEQRSTS